MKGKTIRRLSAVFGVVFAGLSFDVQGLVLAQTAAPVSSDPLKSPLASVRKKAVSDLGKAKSPNSVAKLAELVRDPDVDVRVEVARAIAGIRDLSGVPSMVVFMSDSQSRLRLDGIDGVVEIYTQRDRPRTSRFLSIFSDGRDKPEPLVVTQVDLDVFRTLATRLRDSDPDVRESAAQAIGILGGSDVASELGAALNDVVPSVRAAVVASLVKVGTSADGEALVPLARDANASVRRAAIRGIGSLKVQDAASELRRVFNTASDADDTAAAIAALAQLAQTQDKSLFDRLLLQTDPRRLRPAIEGLTRLGEKSNEARFKRMFQREKSDELRAAYAFGIFAFGDRPFLDTIVLNLALSRDLSRQSRGYIEELGAKVAPDILDYLKDGDPKIRAQLCDALANAGVTDALVAIEPLTKDKDPIVAASASRAAAILKRAR